MSTGFATFLALCVAYALVGVALVFGTATRVRVQRVLRKRAIRAPRERAGRSARVSPGGTQRASAELAPAAAGPGTPLDRAPVPAAATARDTFGSIAGAREVEGAPTALVEPTEAPSAAPLDLTPGPEAAEGASNKAAANAPDAAEPRDRESCSTPDAVESLAVDADDSATGDACVSESTQREGAARASGRERDDSDARSVPSPVDSNQEAPSPAHAASAPADPAERIDAQRVETSPAGSSIDDATAAERTEPPTPEAPPLAAGASQDETDMSSHHVDLPTWMEDSPATPRANPPAGSPTSAARAQPPNEPAAPLPSDPEASDNAEPTVVYLMSPEEIAAEERANSSKPPPSFEPLKALQKLEQDRKRVLTDLEACARAWSDIEKRASQSTAELAKQIDALAKEHSQCDRVRREIETRAQQAAKTHEAEVVRLKTRVNALEPAVAEAKEQRQRADALTQELAAARKDIEAAARSKEELTTRLQKQENDLNTARTRAQTAEEQAKSAQARIGEIEREQEQSNLQFARELDNVTNERDRLLGELQQRDATIQSLTLRCTNQEQRVATQSNEIAQKDAQIADLGQELARLQQELEQQKRAYDAQRAVVEAAQGVMAELRPKLQILETQLTRKS